MLGPQMLQEMVSPCSCVITLCAHVCLLLPYVQVHAIHVSLETAPSHSPKGAYRARLPLSHIDRFSLRTAIPLQSQMHEIDVYAQIAPSRGRVLTAWTLVTLHPAMDRVNVGVENIASDAAAAAAHHRRVIAIGTLMSANSQVNRICVAS